jgi:hypothetical protein
MFPVSEVRYLYQLQVFDKNQEDHLISIHSIFLIFFEYLWNPLAVTFIFHR